ncbi:unnamed protein product [Effrenium voratum]|uniref:J domain-containing protein n=1 Tax=Effrenium voratum TaxID=2562239 RepID=A0AA36J627_9DINO|nr:unnamed protein product [Effrenium voratum]
MTRCDAGKILITRHLAAPWEDPPGPVPSTYSPSAQFGTLEALGETQLIKAVRQNDLRTAQYLLEHRADPNEKDGFGETALMEAAAQGQPNLCKLLLESLANVGYRSPTKLRAQDLAADHVKHFFNMPQSYWHDRGLRLAARQHNLRRAALLLERAKQDKQEVDVNGADGNGFTPLHVCAARAPDSDESRLFTRWLLDEKATVNATNLLGETPLILATRASADAQKSLRLSIVKLLLKSRAAVNTSDSVLHETPLMEAAGIGDSELVLTLLRAGAESARCSASGQSALDFALNDEVKWMLKNPMQATSGSPWPSRQPNSRVPPPPPQPQPQPQQPQPGPRPPFPSFVPKQPGPKTLPKKPQTYSERLQSLLAKYPGFAGSGVEMPSHAWQWSHEELELFIGSMGQFWPPGRARPSMKPGPTAGAGAAGRGRDVWERPKPSLRPHYQVLGVADGTRDQQTLKRAYRQAALKWHPDKNPNDPHAAANFQKACNAFEQICKALGFNA